MLPGLIQFRRYQRGWLRGDILAGVTVAAYLVPQVMAYAEVAGLPPVVGLWATIGPLAVYAVLGSSRQLSIGPESTTALMTAVVLMPIAAGDPARYAVAGGHSGPAGRRDLPAGPAGPTGLPGGPAVQAGLVGYMAGVAVDHDRRPARQGHRRAGRGGRVRPATQLVRPRSRISCTGRR